MEEKVFIIDEKLIQGVYSYLNTKPRMETNELCNSLEGALVLGKEQIDKLLSEIKEEEQ